MWINTSFSHLCVLTWWLQALFILNSMNWKPQPWNVIVTAGLSVHEQSGSCCFKGIFTPSTSFNYKFLPFNSIWNVVLVNKWVDVEMRNTALSLKVLYFLKTIIIFIDFADTSKAITTEVFFIMWVPGKSNQWPWHG